MDMNLIVTIAAPEFISALNNLAVAIAGAAHARVDTPATPTNTKQAKAKLASVERDLPTTPPTSLPATPAATPPAAPSTPAAPRTLDQVKALAALKAKKVGATVVKGLIADTGSAQIADIADPHVLASLAANLEAL